MTATEQEILDARVRSTITRYIVEEGYAPSVAHLAERLIHEENEVRAALKHLHDSHGLVLHPNPVNVPTRCCSFLPFPSPRYAPRRAHPRARFSRKP